MLTFSGSFALVEIIIFPESGAADTHDEVFLRLTLEDKGATPTSYKIYDDV